MVDARAISQILSHRNTHMAMWLWHNALHHNVPCIFNLRVCLNTCVFSKPFPSRLRTYHQRRKSATTEKTPHAATINTPVLRWHQTEWDLKLPQTLNDTSVPKRLTETNVPNDAATAAITPNNRNEPPNEAVAHGTISDLFYSNAPNTQVDVQGADAVQEGSDQS